MGEADAGFFEYRASGQYPRAATTTAGALPYIFGEFGGTIGRGETSANPILQIHQIGFHRCAIDRTHACSLTVPVTSSRKRRLAVKRQR
jgi:hypothetical protein